MTTKRRRPRGRPFSEKKVHVKKAKLAPTLIKPSSQCGACFCVAFSRSADLFVTCRRGGRVGVARRRYHWRIGRSVPSIPIPQSAIKCAGVSQLKISHRDESQLSKSVRCHVLQASPPEKQRQSSNCQLKAASGRSEAIVGKLVLKLYQRNANVNTYQVHLDTLMVTMLQCHFDERIQAVKEKKKDATVGRKGHKVYLLIPLRVYRPDLTK